MSDTDQSIDVSSTSIQDNELATKCWKYVLENPVKTISTATLLWGSLLLLMFFLRIGYMPDVNIESVSSLLYAVSLLGLAITAYTMLMMVSPGLMLSYAKNATDGITLPHLFCISIGAALIWAIMLCHLFGVFAFLTETVAWAAGIAVALLAPLLGLNASKRWPSKSANTVASSTSYKQRWNPQEHPKKIYFWSLVMLGGIVFLLSITLLFITVIGMGGDIRTASNGDATEQLALLVLLIASAAALIGSSKPSDTYKIAILFAPTLLFIVLSTTGSFFSIPTMAIRILGQGEISAARITITGKTCREVNQTLGQRVCADSGEEEATAICPVMIKSRVGSQVVLDFASLEVDTAPDGKRHVYWVTTKGAIEGKTGQRISRRIILDKTKLLSWQPLKAFDERDAEHIKNHASARVASWLKVPKHNATDKEDNAAFLATELADRCGNRLDFD